jgi:hypothetical protein
MMNFQLNMCIACLHLFHFISVPQYEHLYMRGLVTRIYYSSWTKPRKHTCCAVVRPQVRSPTALCCLLALFHLYLSKSESWKILMVRIMGTVSAHKGGHKTWTFIHAKNLIRILQQSNLIGIDFIHLVVCSRNWTINLSPCVIRK